MDEYLGVIKLFAGNYTPRNYMPCDGRLLSIQDNVNLFSLLNNVYGGDGRVTFCLPNLDSPVEGAHYIICVDGLWPQRD